MNFEEILAHHLLAHRMSHIVVGGIEFGPSSHLVMLWIVAAFTVALFGFAARSRTRPALVLRYGVEAVVLYIRDSMLHPIFHEETDAYLPYFLTLFFFILVANLCGLLPYGRAVTGNISVTAGLAICTFGLIHFAGIRAQGPIGYVSHIVPGGVPKASFSSLSGVLMSPLVLAFRLLIFGIEVLGLFAKCAALTIRLFANIISGHIVSLAFLSLIFIFAEMSKGIGLMVAPAAVGLALFVYTLDVLVSILQAYIFTILTAIFVGGAVHPH